MRLAFFLAISLFAADSPESVGFSQQRLQKLHAAMDELVDSKQLAGVQTMVARHGKVIDQHVYGKRDLASGAALQPDTIFRIYSMTKPIIGVAMMMLYEEGKWKASDPVSKYLPEFANVQVYKSDGTLAKPRRAPTMEQLMSHTAGLTYGFFGDTPVDKLYREATPLGATSLKDMSERIAKLPLLYEPGDQWVYSVSVDVQGCIIEKISGMPLDVFLQKRIFEPLGMKDTGFYVPAEKRARFATEYRWNAKGELQAGGTDYSKPPAAPSGGGGLVSTARDYMRFAQMVANKGELDGVRLLSPATVTLMTANHLSSRVLNGPHGETRPGQGFGYDFAVFMDPALAGAAVGKGTHFWSGMAGTWFWIDPVNDVVFVGMIQRIIDPKSPDVQHLSRALTMQALLNPAK
ncbi:MAG: beta-lactamase family protein [Acidobacteria bacterium]|nr:beta-lactamase family protein [Acidobacteriota bacterium]